MNFSRRNATTPFPPSPERRKILAWSRNFMRAASVTPSPSGEGRGAGSPGWDPPPSPAGEGWSWRWLLGGFRHRLHRDVDLAFGLALELHVAIDQGEDRVVAAEADIGAGPDLGPALPDDDVAGEHGLAAVLLDAEAPAGGVAPVARGAACFLV